MAVLKTGSHKASPLGAAVDSARKKRPEFGGKSLTQQGSTYHSSKGRINLKSVAEVLQHAGMDPAAELVKIIKSGQLPLDIHARVLNELLQYTQPKLKSVEVKATIAATGFTVNEDQAKRIAEEFLKAATS